MNERQGQPIEVSASRAGEGAVRWFEADRGASWEGVAGRQRGMRMATDRRGFVSPAVPDDPAGEPDPHPPRREGPLPEDRG